MVEINASRRRLRQSCINLGTVFLLFLLAARSVGGAPSYFQKSESREDPYKVLGVSRHASLDTIKKQWRALSKIHHPDKGGSSEKFASLSAAYEILSDHSERRKYDQGSFKSHQQQRPKTQRQKDAERRTRLFKKQQDAKHRKRAQQARTARENLLRIRSLEEMHAAGILDKNNRFVKNFVGVFVGNKQQEKTFENSYHFPLPFSGEVRNGLQWDDILRTAKIRYNSHTEMTQLFRVPTNAKSQNPHIVFGKAGDSIANVDAFLPRQGASIDHDKALETWIKEHLKSRVTIVNHHHSRVNVFVVHDQSRPPREGVRLLTTLRPNFAAPFTLNIGDKIVAVDTRVDSFPGAPKFETASLAGSKSPTIQKFKPPPTPESWFFRNSAILEEILVQRSEQILEIQESHCFDLSLKCEMWILFGKNAQVRSTCQEQPEFMHNICPASCGVCHRSYQTWIKKAFHAAVYLPIYRFPPWTHRWINLGRSIVEDLMNILALRRTVGFCFFLVGALLGLNCCVLPKFLMRSQSNRESQPKDILSIGAVLATIGFWCWLYFISPNTSLRRDLHYVMMQQVDAICGLLGLGVAITFALYSLCAYFMKSPGTTSSLKAKAWAVAVSSAMFATCTAVLIVFAIKVDVEQTRSIRWRHLMQFRKNIAFAVLLSGVVLGQGFAPVAHQVKKLIVPALVDVSAALVLCLFPLFDGHFDKDFHHVLHMRMNGAVPIVLAGMLVGLGIPLATRSHDAKSRPVGEATCPTTTEALKMKGE